MPDDSAASVSRGAAENLAPLCGTEIVPVGAGGGWYDVRCTNLHPSFSHRVHGRHSAWAVERAHLAAALEPEARRSLADALRQVAKDMADD